MAYMKNQDTDLLVSINNMLTNYEHLFNEEEKRLYQSFQNTVNKLIVDKAEHNEKSKLSMAKYRQDPDNLEKSRKSSREANARRREREKQAKENNLNIDY